MTLRAISGVIGTPRLAVNLVLRGAFRLVPRRLLGPVYALLFRRSQEVGA